VEHIFLNWFNKNLSAQFQKHLIAFLICFDKFYGQKMFHVEHFFIFIPMETVKLCPICNNSAFNDVLSLKDYFYTKESFTIQQCSQCGLKLTNPRPGKDEISRYYESEDYLSHTEEQKTLFSKVYGLIRNINISSKSRIITKNSSGKSILDIGCGVGLLLKYMKELGWSTKGIEPGTQAKNTAETKYGLSISPDIQQLLNQKYDVISMWHVLEHVFEIRDYLLKIKELLNDEGTLFIAVPNILSLDSDRYKNFWAAYDVPRHLYHFRPKDIEELCEKSGLRITKTIPMWFDAFYICILSEKYKGGMFQLIKAIWTAFRSNLVAALFTPSRCTSLIYIIKKE